MTRDYQRHFYIAVVYPPIRVRHNALNILDHLLQGTRLGTHRDLMGCIGRCVNRDMNAVYVDSLKQFPSSPREQPAIGDNSQTGNRIDKLLDLFCYRFELRMSRWFSKALKVYFNRIP